MASYEIRETLQRLADEHAGRFTAEMVVQEATNPLSPLHEHFEWNDTAAGHQYRVDQARALIRSVKIVFRTETREITTVAYVRDPQQMHNEQGYVSVAKLRTDRDEARAALAAEFARAGAALARAQSLASALDLEAEVGDVAQRVRELKLTVEASPANAAPV